MAKQKTIKQSFSLAGLGIHSGQNVRVTINPAPEDFGIQFSFQGQLIPLKIDNVSGSKLATSLGPIKVVEHLLAAIFGLKISNLLIECAATEIPVLDGSSLPFVLALEQAEIVEQKKEQNYFSLSAVVRVEEEGKWLEAEPAQDLTIDYQVDYPVIGQQTFVFNGSTESFKTDIAPARTFGYEKDLQELHKSGLAKGASLENALGISAHGYINAPRFNNEPVRHKILDLIGDLALLGRPLNAKIKAYKASHRLNQQLVRRILAS